MRKTLCLAAGLAVALSASIASAQMTATFYLDARDSFAQILAPGNGSTGNGYANNPNGGGRGDGYRIFIAPKIGATGLEMQVTDTSHATMTMYVDVDSADSAEVLAAVGLDMSIAPPVGNEMSLQGVSATIHNSAVEVGGGLMQGPWNDTAISTAFDTSGGGVKMVRVPVEDSGMGPMFNASLGLTENNDDPMDPLDNTDSYRLVTVDLNAATCGPIATAPASTCLASLDVYLTVNNLLVTAVSNPGPSAAVNLELGYDPGTGMPEGATANGSTEGATSTIADAVIEIRNKGDFNEDGNYNNVDLGSILTNLANPNKDHRRVWTGDFNGDGAFNNVDLGFALTFLSTGAAQCGVCP